MRLPDNIKILCGDADYCESRPRAPFDDNVTAFLDRLSKRLMKSAKSYPDVVSFAYYCRKANIAAQKAKLSDKYLRLGRGLAFHIAPSNVPVNFAFSFVFSLLAGNIANIVRVPTKEYEQVNIIISAIKTVLDDVCFSDIKNGTLIINYPHNDEITAFFSALTDIRIVWGGDATVLAIKKIPAKASTIEIAFFDRDSLCVLSADEVQKLDDVGLKRLALDFYNDTYLMDQNACSSPHIVIWSGGSARLAKQRFWGAVISIIQDKKYEIQPVICVDKLTTAMQAAIENGGLYVDALQKTAYRIELSELNENAVMHRSTCGYYYEYETNDCKELLPLLKRKYQTLTYFGIDKEKLGSLIAAGGVKGIDRLVPVGKALDIELIWDGYNLISAMSRIINC
jgi:hypothetical protein